MILIVGTSLWFIIKPLSHHGGFCWGQLPPTSAPYSFLLYQTIELILTFSCRKQTQKQNKDCKSFPFLNGSSFPTIPTEIVFLNDWCTLEFSKRRRSTLQRRWRRRRRRRCNCKLLRMENATGTAIVPTTDLQQQLQQYRKLNLRMPINLPSNDG